MRWASTLSDLPDPAAAFAEASEALDHGLEGARPDLLLLFASPRHVRAFDVLAALAARRFPGALVAGCSGRGVIGDAREAEEDPALSLTGAVLPGVQLAACHAEMTSLPGPEGDAATWRSLTGAAPESRPKILLLADPFTIDAHALIDGLDLAYPGAPKFGGLASGGRAPGEHRILLGPVAHRSGAAVVAFSGDVEVDTIIAQGCRPIGQPMLVTRCRGGLLMELDRGPPLEVLGELHRSLGERDRELMQHSLFLGLDMREERVQYDPGELLVRNIVGADRETGAITVGATLHPVQAVQFVLRDARSAEEDLRRILQARRDSGVSPPSGALLFSCTGRGAGLFGRPDHDTGLFEETLGPAPLGGFFCNGEIGPVGGNTFLHGYTSAFALFRGAHPSKSPALRDFSGAVNIPPPRA
jgi:small ligand-binding sensory domain FIST